MSVGLGVAEPLAARRAERTCWLGATRAEDAWREARTGASIRGSSMVGLGCAGCDGCWWLRLLDGCRRRFPLAWFLGTVGGGAAALKFL
jgi:hypothetical protein